MLYALCIVNMLVIVVLDVDNIITPPSTALDPSATEEEDETSSGEVVLFSMVGNSSGSTTCLRLRTSVDFSKTIAPLDKNHKRATNSVSGCFLRNWSSFRSMKSTTG